MLNNINSIENSCKAQCFIDIGLLPRIINKTAYPLGRAA